MTGGKIFSQYYDDDGDENTHPQNKLKQPQYKIHTK